MKKYKLIVSQRTILEQANKSMLTLMKIHMARSKHSPSSMTKVQQIETSDFLQSYQGLYQGLEFLVYG